MSDGTLRFVVAPSAESDIAAILAWTNDQFGPAARQRYLSLLERGILDVASDPQRIGSSDRSELGRGLRSYHLYHSRNRVSESGARVHRPRHFLLYRVGTETRVEIVRVLHDTMDLTLHLPPERDPGPPDRPLS